MKRDFKREMEKKKSHFEQEIEEGCAMARIITDAEGDSDKETERRASLHVQRFIVGRPCDTQAVQ